MAADAVEHRLPPGMPRGREGATRFLGMIRTALPALHETLADRIAEGDTVVTRPTWRARRAAEHAFSTGGHGANLVPPIGEQDGSSRADRDGQGTGIAFPRNRKRGDGSGQAQAVNGIGGLVREPEKALAGRNIERHTADREKGHVAGERIDATDLAGLLGEPQVPVALGAAGDIGRLEAAGEWRKQRDVVGARINVAELPPGKLVDEPELAIGTNRNALQGGQARRKQGDLAGGRDASHVVSGREPDVAVGTGGHILGFWHAKFGDHAGRRDPAQARDAGSGEPEIAVGAGRDAGGQRLIGRQRELGEFACGRDAPNLADQIGLLHKPEIAIWPQRHINGGAVGGGDGEEGEDTCREWTGSGQGRRGRGEGNEKEK